jgi:hypothetical protein
VAMINENRITHITRAPLPWRPARLTECGLPAMEHPTISPDEFMAKVKAEGKQRASYSTCMTCWNAARRYFGESGWCESPIEREMAWHRMHRSSKPPAMGPTIADELSAIGALVERHRAEFDELVEDRVQTVRVDFSAKRGARPA